MRNGSDVRKVKVFFYGSFINRDVLARVDYYPDKMEMARLDGFDIVLRPLATLIPSGHGCVYGVLATATHSICTSYMKSLDHIIGPARQTGFPGWYLERLGRLRPQSS